MTNQYTLADISWITILHRLEELQWLPLLIKEKNHVGEYYKRAKNRNSFNKAIIKNSHSILEKGLKDLNKKISEINSLSSLYKKLRLLNG
jgi:hypothetical protein